MSDDATRTLRPEFRPFVIRPAMFAAIPGGFLLAASFFFWTFLQSVIGEFAWAVPALGGAIIAFVLVERLVRYSKTRYEISPDKVVVHTGSIFRSRTVELDLANVTLIEWRSPWLLRTFYGVGHVTAQEAGSAAQPATMSYIQNPGEVYALIGEYMRNHGFRMQRARKVQQEEPGHLGAAVDLTSSLIAMSWALILVGVQIAIEALPLIIGEGPSLLQLVLGNYEVFAESTAISTLVRARIGAVVLGLAAVMLTGTGVVIAYLDLLHRTYTLYDDVIDYVDGFLNETRKFIPLENLADTEVSRPVYKRVMGLSDVRLSSQGAENSIAFASTPNGPAFAQAIEELVREAKRPPRETVDRSAEAELAGAEPVEEVSAKAESDALELRPEPIRAAFRGFGMSTVILSAIIGIGFDFLGDSLEFDVMTAIGIWGVAVTGILALGAAAAVGAGWWVIKARRTSFIFDERGVRRTVSLLSTNDTRFALERITSISVLRNPLDRLLGTMTVRFRSIGSEEDVDFWGIADDTQLVANLRERFELGSASRHRDALEAPEGRLTPEFKIADEFKARAPHYALLVLSLPLAGIVTTLWINSDVGFGLIGFSVLPATVAILYIGLRAWRHARMRGIVSDTHVEVSGGILSRFQHLAPLEHVKAVESLEYPWSTHGRITFRTAGFPIQTAHLPYVQRLHADVDGRLSTAPRRELESEVLAEYAPHVGTELVRHAWLALTIIGLPGMLWFWAYYHRVAYHIEQGRLVADAGLYYDRRVTVLFDRVDHIESQSNFAHGLFDTHDVEVYTVGSPQTDLVFRSVAREQRALESVRARLKG